MENKVKVTKVVNINVMEMFNQAIGIGDQKLQRRLKSEDIQTDGQTDLKQLASGHSILDHKQGTTDELKVNTLTNASLC